jgi:hypothetical protein
MGKAFPIVCVILFCALLTCEPPEVVQSKWTASDIAFDADLGRWKDVLQYPDDPQFGIGVRNNGAFLYICMISWKREINGRILQFGSTVWFSSASKKGKRFGIRFPMGTPENKAAARQGRERSRAPEEIRAKFAESFQEMEILGPGKSDTVPVKTVVAESFGIVVRVYPSEENLIYMIKVPLNADSVSRYAMDIGKDTLVDLAFESIVPTADVGSASDGGQAPAPLSAAGGGMQGGGGMRGGAEHTRPARDETAEPFSVTFAIALSPKPAK